MIEGAVSSATAKSEGVGNHVFYDRLTAGSRLSKQPDRFRPISDVPAFSIITVREICGGRATIPLFKKIGLHLYEAGQTDLFL
jgi:hypothetical protein